MRTVHVCLATAVLFGLPTAAKAQVTPGAVVGEVRTFASGTSQFAAKLAKAGWIPCDGRVLSTLDAKNKPLFDAIGTQWGILATDTTHTFRVPDLRGLFVRGWAPGGDEDAFKAHDPEGDTRVDMRDPKIVRGRVVGSYQPDGNQVHSHLLAQRWGGGFPFAENDKTYFGLGGNRTDSTAPSGGPEARPKNVYVFYAIFAGVAQ